MNCKFEKIFPPPSWFQRPPGDNHTKQTFSLKDGLTLEGHFSINSISNIYYPKSLPKKKIKITSDSLLDGRLNALLYSTEPRSWLRDTIMYAGEKLIICFGIRSLYLGFFKLKNNIINFLKNVHFICLCLFVFCYSF